MTDSLPPMDEYRPRKYQDGFALYWTALNIEMRLSRISARMGYSMTAQIDLLINGEPRIAPKRLSIQDEKQVETFSKSFQRIYPLDEGRWRAMWENLTGYTIAHHNLPDPPQEYADLIASPDFRAVIPFVLNPLVFDKHVTIMFGPSGSYKTTLAYLAAMRMGAVGETAGISSAQAQRGLIVNYELSAVASAAMFEMLRKGHPDLSHAHLRHWKPRKALADCFGDFQRTIRESGATFVVVDSLAGALAGRTDSPDAMAFFDVIAGLGNVTTYAVAQVAKNAEQKTIFGSTMFDYYCRRSYEHQRIGPDTIVLRPDKVGFRGQADPLGFKFLFSDADTILRVEACEPDLLAGTHLERAYRLMLRIGKPMTMSELTDKLPGLTRRVMNEGKELGCFHSDGAGGGRGKETLWHAIPDCTPDQGRSQGGSHDHD